MNKEKFYIWKIRRTFGPYYINIFLNYKFIS
jgi:hypothetical protein